VVDSAGTRGVDVAGTGTLRRTTRATPKVKKAEPMRSKSKGKGKAKVDDGMFDEVWNEELAKLKAKKAAIQAMIDRMEG
jgi:hypothetical protein